MPKHKLYIYIYVAGVEVEKMAKHIKMGLGLNALKCFIKMNKN